MSETCIHGDEQKTFGSRLRETRERKGLSLEDVANTTRISKGYLKALEEGDRGKLPSEAYAKGFLRVYAQFLNVPEEEVTERHEHCSSECQEAGEQGDVNPIHCCSALSLPAKTVWKAVLPFMFLIVIIMLTMFFFSSPKKPLPPQAALKSNPLEENVVAGAVPEKLPDDKPLPAVQEITEQAPSGSADAGGKRFVLRLRAFEDGSLDITIDEATRQHYDLKAGDLIEWKGEKYCALDLENAGGVEAELNGKLLKPFGEKGASAHIVLSAEYNGEIPKR